MITLSTIIYEGNYIDFLKSNWFFEFESKFITDKLIVVNNLELNDNFILMINELKTKYEFSLSYVSDTIDLVKSFFNLDIDESAIGYWYTIPYFVAINSTKTKYLLNVATDCMSDIKISDDFLKKSINELDKEYCSSSMISWVKKNRLINGVTVGENENIETFRLLERIFQSSEFFSYTYGFTDQFFLSKVDNLKNIDYNIDGPNIIYQGPAYGGNSFEKRVVAYQIKNNKYNCVFKGEDYFIHNGNYYE